MISPTGIWSQDEAKDHENSPKLAQALSNLLDKSIPVIDLGCGTGYYVSQLQEAGFNCLGVEGSELFQHETLDYIIHRDLTIPFSLPPKGQVLSFEVGEHIPEQYEQIFIDNLCNNCNSTLIISWALPGQPGHGHVNCRSQEYITNQITSRGFSFDMGLTHHLRTCVDENTPWFRTTLLAFHKK